MRFIFTLSMVFFHLCLLGQGQYRFQHFTIKDGLSQNTVNCVLRDKQGLYWIGTQDGLNLYDGYSVKIFRHDLKDTNTLSDNFILSLVQDQYGNIWVGTRNGFNLFDRWTNRFRRIIVNEQEKADYHNNVQNIFVAPDSSVFFSNSFRQLVKVTHKAESSQPIYTRVVAENTVLINAPPNTYCIGDSNQITLYDSANRQQWHFSDSIVHLVRTVFPLTKNKTLLATTTDLFLLEQGKLTRLAVFNGKSVSNILTDGNGTIWIGTIAGLYLVRNHDFLNPLPVVNHPDDPSSLSANNVQSLYADPDGLIWVGTAEGGVDIYDSRSIFFVFNHQTSIPLSASSVTSIYQKSNELWVGTVDGLNHFVMANDTVSHLYRGSNKIIAKELYSPSGKGSNNICSNYITAITEGRDGRLWFGSRDNGISVFDPRSKQWTHYNTKNSPLHSNTIHHLMCASDGKIWISSLAGFYFFDPAHRSFRSFLPSYRFDTGYPSGYIMSIFEDKHGDVWVSSTMGLYHLTSGGEKITIYHSHPGDTNGLSYTTATSCFEDSRGRLWVATLGGGIDQLDRKRGIFSHYTTKDGLTNNVVHGILEEGENLWLPTNSNISVFNPEKKKFRSLSERDGLLSREFAQNAFIRNQAGEFLFGSPEGLIVCDPSSLVIPKPNVPLNVSSLKINYNEKSFLAGHTIELFYTDKTITFEFAATDFRSQDRLRYSFKLEGFDNDWHDAPASRRIATYTNLPFGNYIFKVRVKRDNEPWQEDMLTVPVNVIPPFWQKTWFIFMEVMLSLGAIIFLVRYYAQRKLKARLRTAELTQKIHEERERISRDLHDNVGSHLTYIISSLDNIGDRREQPDEEIAKLSDFSRSTMQQLRDSIWAINKDQVTLGELKDKISDYANRMTSVSGMHFSLEYSAETDILLTPTQAINVYRVIQEAIHNAVKHSQARALKVSICATVQLTISIMDDGKGIRDKGSGYGLKNMEDRVKEMNGQMKIGLQETGGTYVLFDIPLNTTNALE